MMFIGIIMTLFTQRTYAKKLQYSASRSISVDWGWDLFKSKADTKSSLNSNLAKASAFLCKGTYGGASDIKNRMKTLGFSNISTNLFERYAKDNQANTSPIAFGSIVKKINNKKHLIVVVAIRGTLLDENGWDFITDLRSGVFNADGFFDAGETGRKDTENYIKKQQKKYKLKKKNTVVFITGHSLGAAVAGQIARALQGKLANKSNIYCYTFASPFYKTFGNEGGYTNIHNFVNSADAVPKFPLFGKRNGVDHSFIGNGKDLLGQHDMDVYLDGVLSYFNKSVESVTKKSIALNERKIEISKGEKCKLIATVTGIKNKVTWTSSNKRVATVKGGVITGKGKGITTITAKCGKLKAKCKVSVNVSYNAEQAISILLKKLRSKNKWKDLVYCAAYSVKYRLYDKNGYIEELDEKYGWDNDIDFATITSPAPKRLGSNRVSCVAEWPLGAGSAFVYVEINLKTGKASVYITDEWRDLVKLPKTIQLW